MIPTVNPLRLSVWLTTVPVVLLSAMSGASGQGATRLPADGRVLAETQRAVVEQGVRRVTEQLFARLCPGRCELVEATVTMKEPQPVAGSMPGFESITGGSYEVEPKVVNLTILLDAKLPGNFRTNIPRMLQYRLRELAPVVDVRPEMLNFPEPQLQPMPPQLPEARGPRSWPQPSARPNTESTPQPENLANAEAQELEASNAEKMAEKGLPRTIIEALAPWLGPIILAVLILALLFPLLRRLRESDANDDLITKGPARVDEVRPDANLDIDALRAELLASRAIRNRMLRRWLDEDAESVASLVRLLGPEILVDLKNDVSLSTKLETISEMVAQQTEPLSENERKHLLHRAQARLAAARIVHREQGLAMDWEFLEGLDAGTLTRILAGCTTAESLHVLDQLPPTLRASYLQALDTEQRRELMLASDAAALGKHDAMALATRLRKAADEVAHMARESSGQVTLIVDMLRALPLDDQEDMLRDLLDTRREVARGVLEQVCLETAVPEVPREFVADALHRTPIETLVAFLRGTRDEVRDQILHITPLSKRSALTAELSLDVPVGKDEFLQARQAFTSTLRDIVRRDGHDIADANTRVLSGGEKTTRAPRQAS
ncbi:MAG: hypothetical protein MJE77_01950 [Proteobacteria bacterium]|nr:hypothetical protein [Pseudomonadota bacterium]